MVYEVPKSRASEKQNQFELKFPGSAKVYSLPLMKFLKPELLNNFDEAGMSEVAAFRAVLDAYAPGLFGKFDDAEQFEAFMREWTTQSGVDLGES